MGIEEFRIELNKLSGNYSAGERMTCTVHIQTTSKQNISGIQLTVLGKAEVNLTDEDNNLYRSTETYLKVQTPLRSPEGDQIFCLPAGKHVFRFSLKLPEALAPSFRMFHGRYGSISYKVQVTIDRPWKWSKICVKPFNIVRTPIRSANLSTMMPLEEMLTKKPRFFHNGTITGRIYVLRNIYHPGEKVLVTADIINNTGKSIKSSKIRLVQHVTYRTLMTSKKIQQVLYEHKRGKFRKCEVWSGVEILVPSSAVPSHLPFCSIIDVSYSIQFIINPGILSLNMELGLNVQIDPVPPSGNSINGSTASLESLPPPYEDIDNSFNYESTRLMS